MIKIDLTRDERQRLVELAQKVMKPDRFLPDDSIFPENRILIDKIQGTDLILELNMTEIDIVCNWIYEGITFSQIKKHGDEMLINKIYEKILNEYENIGSGYKIKRLQYNLENIARLSGREK